MSDVQRKGLWARWRSIPLVYRIGGAFVLGIVLGLIVGEPITVIEPLGTLFLKLLSMIVIPIVIFTLVGSMRKLTPSQLGRVGGQTVLIYIITTAIAIIIGLMAANVFGPGTGLTLPGDAEMEPEKAPDMVEVFLGIFPDNVFSSMAEGDVLPILAFSIIFGLALAFVRESAGEELRKGVDTVFSIMETGAQAMFKIVWGVLEYGVIGVFALLAVAFAEAGAEAIVSFGMLILTLLVAVAVHIIVIYLVIIVRGMVGQSPMKFLRGSREAMLTSFATRSSGGTLPVTMNCAHQNLKVHERVYSFSLPLGATINMDGTAMYQGVCAVFAANLIGQSLTIGQQMTVVVTATLASVGTAGVPGSGLIMLTMVLTQLGLPLGVVAFVAGIDPILDRLRTMNNVTGDLAVTTLVGKLNKAVDFTKGAWTGQKIGDTTPSSQKPGQS
jgi:Na+/H+-dicarboxylate symporter